MAGEKPIALFDFLKIFNTDLVSLFLEKKYAQSVAKAMIYKFEV